MCVVGRPWREWTCWSVWCPWTPWCTWARWTSWKEWWPWGDRKWQNNSSLFLFFLSNELFLLKHLNTWQCKLVTNMLSLNFCYRDLLALLALLALLDLVALLYVSAHSQTYSWTTANDRKHAKEGKHPSSSSSFIGTCWNAWRQGRDWRGWREGHERTQRIHWHAGTPWTSCKSLNPHTDVHKYNLSHRSISSCSCLCPLDKQDNNNTTT